MTIKLTEGPATPSGIAYVAKHLWGRGSDEVTLYGLKTQQDLEKHLCGMLNQYSVMLKLDDTPVAVFGANKLRQDHYSTWFIATEAFTAAGLSITRYVRRFLKEKTEAGPKGARVELVSAVGHPDALRWFKALGFEWQYNQGPFSHYLYKGPVKEGLT